MPLIDKKLVTDRETASYKLDRSTVELVRLYAEFIGSPQEHVVNEALVFVFRKDKEFNLWLKTTNKSDLLAKPEAQENGGKRRAKTTTVGSGTSPLSSASKL